MFLQLKMGCEGSTTEEPASSRLAQGFGEKTPVTGKQGESQMKGIDHARIQETVCICCLLCLAILIKTLIKSHCFIVHYFTDFNDKFPSKTPWILQNEIQDIPINFFFMNDDFLSNRLKMGSTKGG